MLWLLSSDNFIGETFSLNPVWQSLTYHYYAQGRHKTRWPRNPSTSLKFPKFWMITQNASLWVQTMWAPSTCCRSSMSVRGKALVLFGNNIMTGKAMQGYLLEKLLPNIWGTCSVYSQRRIKLRSGTYCRPIRCQLPLMPVPLLYAKSLYCFRTLVCNWDLFIPGLSRF